MVFKFTKVSLLVAVISLSGMSGTLFAQSIASGVYKINNDKITGAITVTPTNDGRFLFAGGTKTATGAECMINGPATLRGNELEIGYKCTIRLNASENQIEIDDYKKCIPCDPGAYVSGIYRRQ